MGVVSVVAKAIWIKFRITILPHKTTTAICCRAKFKYMYIPPLYLPGESQIMGPQQHPQCLPEN